MPREDDTRLGPTAHYTAYVWHRIGLPHAEHFSTWQGRLLYWSFFAAGEWATRLSSAVPTMREYLEYRHRLMDAIVTRLQPGLLIELGAGLTRRAVTWAADHEIPTIELDLPGMARLKQQRLAELPAQLQHRLHDRHSIHETDALAPDFAQQLAGWLDGHRRPVVVLEGVLSYFDEPTRRRVIAAVATALQKAGGGALLCEVHTATAQARVGWPIKALRAAQRGLTRRRHAASPFANPDAAQSAFIEAGFDRCQQQHANDYLDIEPRLAGLSSPLSVMLAQVGEFAPP